MTRHRLGNCHARVWLEPAGLGYRVRSTEATPIEDRILPLDDALEVARACADRTGAVLDTRALTDHVLRRAK